MPPASVRADVLGKTHQVPFRRLVRVDLVLLCDLGDSFIPA